MHGPPCSSGLEQSVSIVNVLVEVCCMYIMQIILVFLKNQSPSGMTPSLYPPHQTWCSPQSTTRDGATSRTPTTGIGTALTLDPSVTSLVTSRTVCEQLASTWASTTASGSGTTPSTSWWVELGCTYNYIKYCTYDYCQWQTWQSYGTIRIRVHSNLALEEMWIRRVTCTCVIIIMTNTRPCTKPPLLSHSW